MTLSHVVVVDVSESLVAPLAQQAGLEVRRVGADEAGDVAAEIGALGVMAAASHGVRVAQDVHLHATDVPVLYVAGEPEERDELAAALMITPGIGRHTRVLLAGDAGVTAAVSDELERYRRRATHRRTMARVQSGLGPLAGAGREELSRYLRQVFEHAPIGIVVTDRVGTIRVANPMSGEVLGWPPRHAVGQELAGMFSGPAAARARDLVVECIARKEATSDLLVRTGPEGSTQHLGVTAAPVDPERPSLGVVVLVSDESVRIEALHVADRARADAEAAARRYADMAGTLQESLLPPALPEIPGVELAAHYHPAGDGSEVGGDFYDVVQVGPDEWVAVIGDVCGKGAHAARLTALIRYTARAAAARDTDLGSLLDELNTALLSQSRNDPRADERRFATVGVVRFRVADGEVRVWAGSGGHPPPLVLRLDGTAEALECHGPLLGVFDEVDFDIGADRLRPGEVALLYTDGITEARRGDEQFGDHRLCDVFEGTAGLPAPEAVEMVAGAARRFEEGRTARDDTALLAIRCVAPAPR